jgi:hypothetical protein
MEFQNTEIDTMRIKTFIFAALLCGVCSGAYAELQNVEVGGGIRIRGNWYDFDDSLPEVAFVEQRTRLNFKADFTDNVSTFIEVDNYGNWGTDFRSDYFTGFDTAGGGDVALYQAYIDVAEMWGTPLHLRVGRQEVALGSQWLLGVNDASSLFTGLSHDAILLSYGTDTFTVAAWMGKIFEGLDEIWSEGDTDHYGIYASYIGIEDVTLDAYWIYVMDDHGNLPNADVDLHTIGLRGAGKINAFDFEAEVAYQFGEAELDGVADELDASNLGANLEVGYTFDANIQPRIYLGGAYFGGDADADELSFHRLFSNWEYSEFIENTELSNAWLLRAGASIMPTESVKLSLALTYFQVDDTIDTPGFLFFNGDEGDSDLGWEVGLYGSYQYSEDLAFRAGYAHFFGDDGLDGEAIAFNGNALFAGDEDDDYDYLFVETEIKF